MRRLYYIACVSVAAVMAAAWTLTGCDDMNNYSVSPNHVLAFSTDTVSFDTVFTTVGSVTGYFMVYNKNDEALQIQHITLASGGTSGFRINVDGRRGDNFTDIPIWRKDSLYVAVEVTVNPNDEYQPFVLNDSVVFVTNGVVQAVTLEAYGRNAHVYRGGKTFAKDTILTSDRPYLVYDSVKVAEGVTLMVEKGVTFYMHKGARWFIEGTLITNGVQDEPVTFRGDRLNDFSTTISYDNIAAQWQGIYFRSNSFDNKLNYTMVRNGIVGLRLDESTPDRKKLDVQNSQIRNMDGDLLWAINCNVEASNSEFSNASGYLALLVGGTYRFAHCTFANYMPPVMISNGAARSVQCLVLTDHIIYVQTDGSEQRRDYPLRQAYFDNCIIDGSMSIDSVRPEENVGELQLITADSLVGGDDDAFNYRFNHCLIKTLRLVGDRFEDCIFVSSPAYVKGKPTNEENKYDYVYDFRPAKKSSVIGKADRNVSKEFPYDRYGVNRLTSDSGPTIGAYEYEEQEEDDD